MYAYKQCAYFQAYFVTMLAQNLELLRAHASKVNLNAGFKAFNLSV